jgi:microcystin-dependent protein
MEPYLGEIRMFAGPYAPVGWLFCNGLLLSISQYEALYALLGTTYGGDGRTNFALPDLRSRLPVGCTNSTPPGMGNIYPLGATGGSEAVTLTQATMPAHTHAFNATNAAATTVVPSPQVTFAKTSAGTSYAIQNPGATLTLVNLSSTAISNMGSSAAHENRMPALAINYIIATNGIYPTAN